MDGRDLVRSVRAIRRAGPADGLRAVRAAWRRERADAAGLPSRRAERARAPGEVIRVAPGPGGGVVEFTRSRLQITVTSGGALFCGWEGAGPLPSYALAGPPPEPDQRVCLEPDTEGGWRVMAERLTATVSRHGVVEVHTPGGVRLRRDQPPRWWEADGGGGARWVQRSEVAADARFFGLGGRASGPRLRDGTYRLWNTDPQRAFGPGDGPLQVTMPVQTVVADAGTHLVFHDTAWEGTVTLQEGVEGAGSGHDRAGGCELRMEGGPLRCWVAVGTPARVLHLWASLTGAPVLPPAWAFGHHHVLQGPAGEEDVRRVVAAHRAQGLPLDAVHLDPGPLSTRPRPPAAAEQPLGDLPQLAAELRAQGVHLVSSVTPGVPVVHGHATGGTNGGSDTTADGARAGALVRDAAGRPVRGEAGHGESVYPDFTDPLTRRWWGGLYGVRLAQGFDGFAHTQDVPVAWSAFGDATLPRSARHVLDGAGGDHRAAHNVYGLGMARAAHESLARLRPDERPLVLARSGWAGMQRYAGVCPGVPAGGWEGLRAALSVVIGLGLCGVPHAGPELVVGGRDDGRDTDLELRVRSLQLAAHLPLLRTRGGPGGPWPGSPEGLQGELLGYARAVFAGRRRLGPLFLSLAHLARRTGAPLVRPVWWRSPEDRALRDCEDAFLLGDVLLVAPVLQGGVGRRPVRLPPGRWYDTYTEKPYEGPGQVVLDAPLTHVPVLARGGAIVPVPGPDGPELEAWAPAPGRSGGGSVALEAPEAAAGPECVTVERYITRRTGARVTVLREDAAGAREPELPVRVRGL